MSSPRTLEDSSTGSDSRVPPHSDIEKAVRRPVGEGPLRADTSSSELVERGAMVNNLPDELLLKIFSYMTLSENVNILQEVCSRWKILAQDAHLWYNMEYVIRYDTTEEEAVSTLAAVPQLRRLALHTEVSPRVFDTLRRSCPHLTTLETTADQQLTYSEATDLFVGCKEIRTLAISDRGQSADKRYVDAVALLADLRVLHLKQHLYTEMQVPLRALAEGCPHLCDLNLGMLSYEIRDAECFLNSHRSVLRRLHVKWASVEGRSIAPLLPACADSLEDLRLFCYNVSHEEGARSLVALGQLRSLQRLFFGVGWDARQSLPTVFRNGRLSKLRQLGLEDAVVDETTRALSEHCPELRELSLHRCGGHTDALFEPLRRLRKLEVLQISSCKCLGGKTMLYIAKLQALHSLHFSYIRFVTLRPSAHCILEMSGLRSLHLKESICWDIPFHMFPGRLVNLRELVIDYCDGPANVLDGMRAQMPDLRVEGNLGAFFTDEEDSG